MESRLSENQYSISTNKRKLQLHVIHNFLTNSYWAEGIPLEAVKKQIRNSLCFGVYYKEKQVGYARIITDYTSFAYLCDLFIVEEHRGRGLSKMLMEKILGHKELKRIKNWMLATADAHKLYEKFGFASLKEPERYMKRVLFAKWNDIKMAV
jgi:GNAT superfamily N-acetyltransferase